MIQQTSFVKVKGTPIDLGEYKLIMPPLSLGMLEQFQAKLKEFDEKSTSSENISFFIDAVHSALRRNYPAITREDVADNAGLESMAELMACLARVSGLVHSAPPGEDAAGKELAGMVAP